MKHQPGTAIRVVAVSGISFPCCPSAAPVVGRSLAGRAFCKASPRYKVSPMGEVYLYSHIRV